MIQLNAAERILLDLGISQPNEIDLEVVAWSRGAVVKYRQLHHCEARIVGSADRAIISVNKASLPTRQRFSIAHEIGHWHHHRGQLLICSGSEIGNPAAGKANAETQADEFASNLILPNYLVRPRLQKIKTFNLKSAREIGAEFQVSLTATLLKAVQLNQFPIIVACYNKFGRRWFKRSVMVPEWWFPNDLLDANSFAFDMLFKGTKEETYPRKMGADAWFTFRHADRFEVTEQSFSLPGDEILTLLTIPYDGLN